MHNTYPKLTFESNIDTNNLILVGSDDQEITHQLSEIFNNQYQLEQIKSGMEALRYVQSSNIALILLDLDHLDLDGILAARVIKSRTKSKHIPMIILHTDSLTPQQMIDGCRGCIDYIEKPPNINTLMHKIRNFIRLHKCLDIIKNNPIQISEANPQSSPEYIYSNPQQESGTIFHGIKDIFIVVDNNLKITYLNRTAAISMPILLNSSKIQIGIDYGKYLKNSGQYTVLNYLERTIKQSKDLELELLINNSWYNVSFYKTVTGAEIHFNDISLLKQLENDAIRMNIFNISTEMAASVAHEIKNPMTTIRALLELAKLAKKPIPQDKIDIMIEEIDRVSVILTDFLALSKNANTTKESCQIENLITNLEPLLSAKATRLNKNIIYKLKPCPEIQVNLREISQVVLNLVLNGLEAMETQGTDLTIATDYNEETTALHISDQGPGIDPKNMKNIWTPFFTSKVNGTGLGLTICQKLARKNNALIDVKSDKSGTRFSIYFFPETD